jgi:membrane-bound lytic murein transglycosylase D
MRVDDAVDERLDPYRSTEAAAQLLAYNYRVLGSWPLALTAYNHGAAGMRRARETVGTDDFVKINRTYNSRTFGFASRNFFPSFLAALTIDENPEKYFGPLERRPEQKFREITMPAYVRLTTLERTLGLDREQLRVLNPAWRPPIYQGTRLVPRGYRLRLPADTADNGCKCCVARAANERHAGQITPRAPRCRVSRCLTLPRLRTHRVAPRRDEPVPPTRSCAPVADCSFRTAAHGCAHARPPQAILSRPRHHRRNATAASAPCGRFLRGPPRRFAAADRGARAFPRAALKMNAQDPDRLHEGQRAHCRRSALRPDVRAAARRSRDQGLRAIDAARGKRKREGRGGSRRARRPARPRQRENEAWPGAIRRRGGNGSCHTPDVASRWSRPRRESARAGVRRSQAEDLSPSLGPAGGTQALADSIDYQVRDDGTIRVEATETLGHYADWLQIPTQNLRNINKLKARQPVLLGQKLKLDYSRVSRENFEQLRRDYHAKLQGEFFVQHRITGTEVYIVRRGDSLWTMTQKFSNLPIWLLRQYNPDTDLSDLRPGTQVVMPRVEILAGS